MKKLLVFLTIVWAITTGSLFAGTENINLFAKIINTYADFLKPYNPIKTWIELGIIGGTILLTMLWTLLLIKQPTKSVK